MISALKALKKQNKELQEILKKRASKNYADLKARSGSKIAEGSKTTQTLTKTEKRAENCPKSSDFFDGINAPHLKKLFYLLPQIFLYIYL